MIESLYSKNKKRQQFKPSPEMIQDKYNTLCQFAAQTQYPKTSYQLIKPSIKTTSTTPQAQQNRQKNLEKELSLILDRDRDKQAEQRLAAVTGNNNITNVENKGGSTAIANVAASTTTAITSQPLANEPLKMIIKSHRHRSSSQLKALHKSEPNILQTVAKQGIEDTDSSKKLISYRNNGTMSNINAKDNSIVKNSGVFDTRLMRDTINSYFNIPSTRQSKRSKPTTASQQATKHEKNKFSSSSLVSQKQLFDILSLRNSPVSANNNFLQRMAVFDKGSPIQLSFAQNPQELKDHSAQIMKCSLTDPLLVETVTQEIKLQQQQQKWWVSPERSQIKTSQDKRRQDNNNSINKPQTCTPLILTHPYKFYPLDSEKEGHLIKNSLKEVISERREVKNLAEWLDTQMKACALEIGNEGASVQSLHDLFTKQQLILSAGFDEITRQISIECAERAELLQKIWQAMAETANKILSFLAVKADQMEWENVKEATRLHGMYRQKIEELTIQLGKVSGDGQNRDGALAAAMMEHKLDQRINKKISKQFAALRAQYKDLLTNYNMLVQQHIELNVQQGLINLSQSHFLKTQYISSVNNQIEKPINLKQLRSEFQEQEQQEKLQAQKLEEEQRLKQQQKKVGDQEQKLQQNTELSGGGEDDDEEYNDDETQKLKKEREEQIYNSIFQSKAVGTADYIQFVDNFSNTQFLQMFTKEMAVQAVKPNKEKDAQTDFEEYRKTDNFTQTEKKDVFCDSESQTDAVENQINLLFKKKTFQHKEVQVDLLYSGVLVGPGSSQLLDALSSPHQQYTGQEEIDSQRHLPQTQLLRKTESKMGSQQINSNQKKLKAVQQQNATVAIMRSKGKKETKLIKQPAGSNANTLKLQINPAQLDTQKRQEEEKEMLLLASDQDFQNKLQATIQNELLSVSTKYCGSGSSGGLGLDGLPDQSQQQSNRFFNFEPENKAVIDVIEKKKSLLQSQTNNLLNMLSISKDELSNPSNIQKIKNMVIGSNNLQNILLSSFQQKILNDYDEKIDLQIQLLDQQFNLNEQQKVIQQNHHNKVMQDEIFGQTGGNSLTVGINIGNPTITTANFNNSSNNIEQFNQLQQPLTPGISQQQNQLNVGQPSNSNIFTKRKEKSMIDNVLNVNNRDSSSNQGQVTRSRENSYQQQYQQTQQSEPDVQVGQQQLSTQNQLQQQHINKGIKKLRDVIAPQGHLKLALQQNQKGNTISVAESMQKKVKINENANNYFHEFKTQAFKSGAASTNNNNAQQLSQPNQGTGSIQSSSVNFQSESAKKIIQQLRKTITSIYMDLIAQIRQGESMQNNMFNIFYDYYMQQFGLKKVAESKLQKALFNVMLFKDALPDVYVFAILLGVDGEKSRPTEAQLNFTLNSIIALDENQQFKNFSIEKMTTNQLKIYEIVPKILKDYTGEEESLATMMDLLQLQRSSSQQFKGKNLLATLQQQEKKSYDLNLVVKVVLDIFTQSTIKMVNLYGHIFYSVAIQQPSDYITPGGFQLLMTNLDPQRDLRLLIREFNAQCVEILVGEFGLQFEQFLFFCKKFQLFDLPLQQAFLQRQTMPNGIDIINDENFTIPDILNKMTVELAYIKKNLFIAHGYQVQHKQLVDKIHNFKSQQLLNAQINEKRLFLYIYKILKSEVRQAVSRMHFYQLLPSEFLKLQEQCKELITKDILI